MYDSIDVFTSRRKEFNECLYWCRTDRDIEHDIDITSLVAVDEELNEIAYERVPNGLFYASEVEDVSSDNQIIGGSFMFDESFVTLETNDDVHELKLNDVVCYDGKIWRVTRIGRKKKKRQSQYSRTCAYKTYISLKR